MKKMNIKVRTLRETLSLLEPVLPRKSTLKPTQYFLLENGKAVADNLEVRAEMDMPEANESVMLPKEARG